MNLKNNGSRKKDNKKTLESSRVLKMEHSGLEPLTSTLPV